MRHDVFISYAVRDAASAETVCRAVEDAGIACWIAPRDALAGEIYADAIVGRGAVRGDAPLVRQRGR